MTKLKVLNLYAGIGGNRKLWENVEVTAVENDKYIAGVYKELFPNDTVIVADAHEYLVKHFKEYDFIWSSPPCPTHSRTSLALVGWDIYRYPDMALYQEIIFLEEFYKGAWVVENVVPYYKPLVSPRAVLDRHTFWSSRNITDFSINRIYKGRITDQTKEVLAKQYAIELPEGTKYQRKLLRNAVDPKLGLHVFNEVTKRKVTNE